jgi:hypothetical protein
MLVVRLLACALLVAVHFMVSIGVFCWSWWADGRPGEWAADIAFAIVFFPTMLLRLLGVELFRADWGWERALALNSFCWVASACFLWSTGRWVWRGSYQTTVAP